MTDAASPAYDPIIFDLVGQYAFENLPDQPFHSQLDELNLPPNVGQAWSNFAFHARSSTSQQTDVNKTLPSSVTAMIPKVNDPGTKLWWEEVVKEPSSQTWSQLRDGSHSSQAGTSQSTASPIKHVAIAARSPSTSRTIVGRPKARPLEHRRDRSEDDEEEGTAFFRRSKRSRTSSTRLSGYETATDGESERKRTDAPKRGHFSKGKARAVIQSHNRGSSGPSSSRPGWNGANKTRQYSDEEAITSTPTRAHPKRKGAAAKSASRKVSSSRSTQKGPSSRSKAPKERVNVDNIEDASEKEAKEKSTRGVGSKGSAYYKYFIPKAKSLEWNYPRNDRPRYQAIVQMFMCRFCESEIPITNDTASPMALHFNQKHKSSLCRNLLDPKDHSLRGTFGPYVPPAPKEKGSRAASSYSAATSDKDVAGWLA
ncbi:hypothetical protein CF327_g130 [Tilletia walkeri]|nr:hypothetical protein CF327_g130 [Tilletia walkeri]